MKKDVSEINFTIELDDKKMPSKIKWSATEADFEGQKECDSLMVFLWDKEEKNTLSINLWTREMLVNNMNMHVFQALMTLADTYKRATGNSEVSEGLIRFANEFATATGVSVKS